MNKLMSIKEWRENRFVGDRRPAENTIRRWCENGDVPAKKIGKQWFIDVSVESVETGNSLVDKVLAG